MIVGMSLAEETEAGSSDYRDRLLVARASLKDLAEGLNLPVENLLTPDYVRRVVWEPPDGAEAELSDLIGDRLEIPDLRHGAEHADFSLNRSPWGSGDGHELDPGP